MCLLSSFLTYTIRNKITREEEVRIIEVQFAGFSLWKLKCHDRRSLKSHLFQYW